MGFEWRAESAQYTHLNKKEASIMTHTTLTATEFTNEEITGNADTLKALIAAGRCARGTIVDESFDWHNMHRASDIRINEWAQSILGTDMHFSMRFSDIQKGDPTVTLRHDTPITDKDTDNIFRFIKLLSDADIDYVTLHRQEKEEHANGDRFFFSAMLHLTPGDDATLDGFKSRTSSNDPYIHISKHGAVREQWETFRALSMDNFDALA